MYEFYRFSLVIECYLGMRELETSIVLLVGKVNDKDNNLGKYGKDYRIF